jgi:transcriptional regulator with XRE-family HTH domain
MAILKDTGDPIPNKFTIAMGELIKKAREEARLSQDELAQRIYRRRETLSVIENGRSEVGTITLAAIAANTGKPLTYFYPKFAKHDIVEEQLSSEEQEILLEFRRIGEAKTQQMALGLVKQLADADEKEMEEIQSQEFIDQLSTLDKDDPLYKRFKKRGLIE